MTASYDLGYLPEPRGNCENKGATGSTDRIERRGDVVDNASVGLPRAVCTHRVAIGLGTADRCRGRNAAVGTVSSRSGSVSARRAVAWPHGAAGLEADHSANDHRVPASVIVCANGINESGTRSLRGCGFLAAHGLPPEMTNPIERSIGL